MESPLSAPDSPPSIQFSNLAFDEVDIELETTPFGGHILHLAILIDGMGHHVDPTDWPPYDE
ncbi:hypothetical protein AC579_6880 [Pseudocercospora musae]|uniref:Uncharacterized protein n=1 Tax=Pseudocercospora musae TaxID=113226 RepID=A0A139HLE9_9PEZI|nr:hypothetical protein AC579_6880 [Pseudocercospora musae]